MGTTRRDKLLELSLLQELEKRKARKHLLKFTEYTFPKFQSTTFHKTYYEVLDRFAKKQIKKLIVTIPPQSGKSEGATRRLPAMLLGIEPDLKIGIASYNTTFARKFNRDVQRIIDSPDYHKVYPKTLLNASNVVTVSSSYLRNSDEFEVVNHVGGLKAVGRGGALTGSMIDIMIMDDLYKDYAEGNSPVIREAVWDWYTSVVKTRLHNDSQELIVFTRWHEDDLIGRLEKAEKVVTITSLDQIDDIDSDTWIKINFEALMAQEPTDIDQREKGEALWKEKHSKKKLENDRALDPEKFNCLHQGDPQSKEGLLYGTFKTYKDLPETRITKNYTDTADTGDDYLCSIVYAEPLASADKHLYVLDILYTQKSMEHTEKETIQLLNENDVNEADIESNNGGRGFARVVQDGVRCDVRWFHQSKNKESRIFSQSATVNRTLVFPNDWHIRWSEFYDHVTKYKKLFKANKHDDAADTMTGIIEKNATGQGIGIIW